MVVFNYIPNEDDLVKKKVLLDITLKFGPKLVKHVRNLEIIKPFKDLYVPKELQYLS